MALLANGQDDTVVWLYRNTGSSQEPYPREPSAEFSVDNSVVIRDGPTVADFDGDGISDLILGKRGEPPGVRVLLGSRSDGLDPHRVISIELDYTPHFDTRLGAADFNGDGRLDLAGFGPSATGAVGIYIWLQPRD